MMLLSQSICSILLALSFLFNRAYGEDDSRVLIGYRYVSQKEAAYINEHKRPYREDRYDIIFERTNMLGKGLYLTDRPDRYPGFERAWRCAIKADRTKIQEVSKIWIPEYYWKRLGGGEVDRKKLWHFNLRNENNIGKYIESMRVPNPDGALRFAYIPYLNGRLQMVIPSDLINKNELDFWAQCWQTEEEMEKEFSSEAVDWKKWKIAGDPVTKDKPNKLEIWFGEFVDRLLNPPQSKV
ncbi:hypothetical protein LZ554_000802 [Drepanopeziza brunnea f. sp. 'monogermtubi']|nr:hypothetical protein LZ554_000802 [Drepanopeziza brunnea f. sp. 'monogermtubi']